MIGFNYLGKMGQLGNQMFQYAALRGIAKNRNLDFCIPYHNEVFNDSLGNKLRIELFEPFVLKSLKQSNIGVIQNDNPRTEGQFNFNETLFNKDQAQSTKCFSFSSLIVLTSAQNSAVGLEINLGKPIGSPVSIQ